MHVSTPCKQARIRQHLFSQEQTDGQTCKIGPTGFEPATPSPPAKCATKLRHGPTLKIPHIELDCLTGQGFTNPMNTQYELRATVSNELAEALDAYFLENELSEWCITRGEADAPYEVLGIFPNARSARTAVSKLQANVPDLPKRFVEKTINDADWQNAYKTFVKPWNDRQLYWIPLWERNRCTVPEHAAAVYLDAGMAFGTGAHETTRLCARRLLDYCQSHDTSSDKTQIIDAGCGSGILAFSAAALGFSDVFGFDIDSEAIAVCRKNAVENSHIATPNFAIADLENGLKDKQADLTLANIQTDVLVPNSSWLIRSIRLTGTLILSGLLTKEVHTVRTHYAADFARLRPEATLEIDSRQDNEWSDLQFKLSLH